MVDLTTILLITVVVLFIWVVVISVMLYRVNKKNELFFDDDSKNLRDLVTRSINEHRSILQRASKIEDSIDGIAKIINHSYQKLALVRYNPFSDTGSDQSFSLALLDLKHDGFVITSIHGRDLNRVYAKQIIDGKSKHNLSAEEEEAIRRAKDEK
jgi:hypothetical protein